MEIEINNLPLYSPWCARIIGLEQENIHYKTPEEVKREYADEKWKEVCSLLEESPGIRLYELESKLFGNDMIVTYFDNKLLLMKAWSARKKLYSLYFERMKPYFAKMHCLVELGAGYGSVIMNLLLRVPEEKRKVYSGEYTSSGLKAQSILARNEGLSIATGECDFFSLKKAPVFLEAKHGVVFTSWAVAYVPLLTPSFVDYFLEFEPQYVIHFEPCYNLFSMDTLHGQMCRRYMQLNDYNRNLVEILCEAQRNKKIDIVYVEKNFYGTNPLAPVSMIVWKPI